MTEFLSYLADLTDPTYSTPEVNLNGMGASFAGPFEIVEDSLDLGAPDMDGTWLSEEGKDDDVLSSHRRGRVQSTFRLRAYPSATFEDLRFYVLALNRALDRFGVWVHQPPGQVDPLFIDYYPSPLSTPFVSGDRALFKLFSLLQSVDGIPVTILRRRAMRSSLLLAEVNLAHNGTLAEDHNDDGVPTFWQWLSATNISADAFSWRFKAYHASIAVAAERFFYQDADAGVVQVGSTYTFSPDVAAAYSVLPGVKARIDWYTAGDAFLSSSKSAAMTGLYPPASAFRRPTITAVAPATAAKAKYGVEITPASAATVTLYLRAMQFEQAPAASAFRPGFETISNDPDDPFSMRMWAWNPGDTDALAQLRVSPDSGAQTVEVAYSRRSGYRDSQMAMRIGFAGWRATDSTTLLNGAAPVSDTDAAGDNAVETSLIDDVFKPCLRHEISQPEESAMRGTWRLRAAIRGDVDDAYQIEAHYGIGDVADLPNVMTRRRLDLTSPPSASQYYVVDLGLFRIPTGAPGWFVELWVQRESGNTGTGELHVSALWVEPADDHMNARARILGVLNGEGVTETFPAANMVTPPDGLTADPVTSDPFTAGNFTGTTGDVLNLNEQWEAGGILLTATDDLSAVLHTWTLSVNMFTALTSTARKHGEFRVHDLTTDTQTRAVSIISPKGATWTNKLVTLTFTPTAGHAYLIYSVMSNVTSIGNINMLEITHSFIPPVEGGVQTIAIDADARRAYILDGEDVAGDLKLQPPFPTLMPQLNLIRIASADVATNGSDAVLDAGPAFRHIPDRLLVAGINLIPRWTT